MPTITERRKVTQRRALARQRGRLVKYARERKALARLRAAIRKARANITGREKLIHPPGVTIKGNVAKSGSPRQRLVAVALAAADAHARGKRKSFYSMVGAWTVKYAITGEPRGYRSDCSQWVTSVYWSAGLPDPNGEGYTGGYTGTLGNHGRQVPAGERQPGDLGLYGIFPHHHVEMYIGNGRFVGHGSPPIDGVTPGLPSSYRRYV